MADRRPSSPAPVSGDPLLNLAQAAARLNLGESTLRQKLYAGRGPAAIKLPGSTHWRFRPSDLEGYVKGGEITPAAKAESEAKNGKTPRTAGDGLPNAPPAKALDDQSGARRQAPGAMPVPGSAREPV